MSMDRVTESIAHFIGAFELAEENGRLRAQYDKIAAQRPPDEDLGDIAFKGLHLKPEHPLEDLEPQITYQPLPPTPFWILAMPPRPADAPQPEIVIVMPSPALQDAPGIGSDGAGPRLVLPYELPPPSSVVALFHMINRLDDTDWFGDVDPALMAQMSGLSQLMHTLTEQVLALSPFSAPLPLLAEGTVGTLDWATMTPAIIEAAGQLAGGMLDAVVLLGPEAEGPYVDGVAVDTLPDWQTLWPEFLTREAAAQGGEETEGSPAKRGDEPIGDDGNESGEIVPDFVTGWDRALEGLAEGTQPSSAAAEQTGPLIVTGANQLVNEVTITSDWLDAPVITVEGDVHRFDAVSQLNMVFDRDQGAVAAGSPSLAQNAASITTTSDPDRDETTAGQQPSGWAIARISGDLVQINGLQQYNFANDSDVARIEIGSGGLHLGLGENQLDNLAVLNQFGWVFDLIIVGGQMIDVNLIRQVNLLVDDDTIEQPISTATKPEPQPLPTLSPTTPVQHATEKSDEVGRKSIPNEPEAKPLSTAPSNVSTVAATELKGGAGMDQHLAMNGGVQPGRAQAKEPVSENLQQTAPTAKATSTSEHVSAPAKSVSPTASPEPVAGPPSNGGATTSPNSGKTDPAPVKVGSHEAGSKPMAAAEPAAHTPSAAKPLPIKAEPTNIDGGADDQAAAVKPLAKPAAVPAPENLAYNEARIQTEGQDLVTKLPAALAEASAALAKGAETLEQEILGLDLFEGVELLKVLLIEGDFTTINWIDQINVLGDSDRVELLQEAIAALPGAQMVTGSNLLANIATIVDRGMDTQLMAKGEVYSDALLHQAGLVEEGTPIGANGPAALASEAVAFLADGMIEAGMADLEAAQAEAKAELAAMSASQADLMQTMLS